MYVTKDAAVVVGATVVVVVDAAGTGAGAGVGVVATPPDTCSQHDANVTFPYQHCASPPAP